MELITKITDECREKKKANWNMKISTYLRANHSDDGIVMEEADPKTCGTFKDLERTLKYGGNVYKVIGINDSVVREYAFEGLANLMGVGYDHIYNLWIS